MQNAEALTRQQMDEFLAGREGIGFTGKTVPGFTHGRSGCWWAGVSGTEQEAAWRDPAVCQQDNGVKPGADHTADPQLRKDGQGGIGSKPAVASTPKGM